MPEFDSTIRTKIEALRTRQANGESLEVFQMVQVDWPEPDGPINYAAIDVTRASVPPPVDTLEVRIIPDSKPDWFLPVVIDATIGDEELELEMDDIDGVISDLLVDHGEGLPVTLQFWFPEEELLLPVWYGHLRLEDESEPHLCKLKAVQGFRSSEGLLPRRAHWKECQAIFGALFDTQEAIDDGDCPYNRHIGGGVGNLNVGVPYTSCPRRTIADCTTRLSNNGNFMLSHQTAAVTVANNQTKGQRLFSTSQGNETNLKDTVPVVMGLRRIYNMPVLASRKDENNNDPDRGFIFAIFEGGEGPVRSMSWPRVQFGGDANEADPFNFNYRLGTKGQTAMDSALTTFSYSGTAVMRARSGWVDPTTIDISSVNASVLMEGLDNIRVYSDADSYTEIYTTNRVWQIARMLCDKRWGVGYDYARLNIESFIEAAEWAETNVRFTDFNGDEWDHTRSVSHVELRARKIQQQIEDMCMAGRLSRPFWFDGKIHIVPLKKLGPQVEGIVLEAEGISTSEIVLTWTEPSEAPADPEDIPTFTDRGSSPNIVFEQIEGAWMTSIKRSRTSDLALPNRIECTFDDASDDYLEKPLSPVEDIDAQLRAGVVQGDNSRKINTKKFALAGVVEEGQAIKVSSSLLEVGPFDEGGTQNNLELTFKAWYLDCLDLYQTRIIRVDSAQIDRYGFEYFRVKKMEHRPDLQVELTVQAYNADWYDAFEQVFGTITPEPDPPPDPEPPAPNPPTDPLVYGAVTYGSGVLNIAFVAT